MNWLCGLGLHRWRVQHECGGHFWKWCDRCSTHVTRGLFVAIVPEGHFPAILQAQPDAIPGATLAVYVSTTHPEDAPRPASPHFNLADPPRTGPTVVPFRRPEEEPPDAAA